MGKITELPSEDDGGGGGEKGRPEILTAAEREQVLFQSGVLEKLGLPNDCIPLEEAQKQLEAQRSADQLRRDRENARRVAHSSGGGGGGGSGPSRAGPSDPHPEWTAISDSDADSSDDYGAPSDDEAYTSDDTAEKLMREQQARGMSPRVESALDVVIWTMPFGFLFTLLEVLVRQQYGEAVGVGDTLQRLAGTMPLLGAFIWFNLTSQRRVLLQLLLFLIFTICTPALIYIVNQSSYDVVIRRVPPLGTLSVFAAVRLDLVPTFVGLAIVAFWIKWADMKIVFD